MKDVTGILGLAARARKTATGEIVYTQLRADVYKRQGFNIDRAAFLHNRGRKVCMKKYVQQA